MDKQRLYPPKVLAEAGTPFNIFIQKDGTFGVIKKIPAESDMGG
jgi:hypothetical protein